MKNKFNEPVEIDEADVPIQVRRDAGMFGPEGDDFGPRYIIAGDKAYRRRQGIWQGKALYKPSAPGQWYVEDAPEDGMAKGQPGLEEPAPLKLTEAGVEEKKKHDANEAEAVEEMTGKKADEKVDHSGDPAMLTAKDAKAQVKAQAASNKVAPAPSKWNTSPSKK